MKIEMWFLFLDDIESHDYSKEYVKKIVAGMTGFDDEFFNALMQNNPEGITLLLRIILRIPDLELANDTKTQETYNNIFGKSIRLDCYAASIGKRFDAEIQRKDKGAGAHRARYNSSVLDASITFDGENYDDLPDTYVIFITEHDIAGDGKPYHEVERMWDNGKKFNDGSHIIYVNGEYKGNDAIGRLIHDLHCVNPADMYYKELRDRANDLKNTEEGVRQMSERVEQFVNEFYQAGEAKGKADNSKETALKLLKRGKMTVEEIAEDAGLTLDEVIKLQKSLMS